MSTALTRDFAVVGGGLVGAAIAVGLARVGLKPLVLDGEDLDMRASRANFALVWVQGKGVGAPHYALWSKASAELWPSFAGDLFENTGIDVRLRQTGGFSFALSRDELDHLREDLETIESETKRASPPYEVLSHNETKERLPELGREVVGSIYSPADGDVNSLRLLRALHIAMQRAGIDYRSRHLIDKIEPVNGAFRLTGRWGSVTVQRVVLAAGIDNQRLSPMVGLSTPLRSSKGQILVTEKCAPFLPFASGTIRQADEGGVMIGDSEETNATTVAEHTDVATVLARRAIKTFPLLADVNVIRTWAGFRVDTVDGLPIYEQSAQFPGAYVVTSHSAVTLAAGHALSLAPQIARGSLSGDFDPFRSGRFHVRQAA